MATLARDATKQRAARDIVLQIVVRILNLALGVVVTSLVVRTLGATGYGQWSTILVVLTLVGFFAGFGMEAVALRESARDPDSEQEWIGAALMMRLILVGPVIILSVLAIVLLHRNQQMLVAGVILVATMPFSGVSPLELIFRLRVNNAVPMLVMSLRSILWGGAVALIFWQGGGLVELAIAMSATNAVGTIIQATWAVRMWEGRWPRPSRAKLSPLIREAIPVGISGALVIAYARIDQLIVFGAVGSTAAGLYGSVYNLVDQSHFVPISVMRTLYPVLAASWPADRERLLRTTRLTVELMAITSLGALAFTGVAADEIVSALFGPSFAPAAAALPVLFGAFVFICFGYVNGQLLIAMGLQRRLLIISVAALVVNLAGNLAFVPEYGFMAAAWITLATEVVVFAASFVLIKRKLELPMPKPGRVGRTVVAAAVMTGLLGIEKLASAPLSVLIATACVSYPTLLLGLGALSLDDVRAVVRREPTP